jgi:hypothetical protein
MSAFSGQSGKHVLALSFSGFDTHIGQLVLVSVTDLCVAAWQQPLRKSRRADFRHIYGVSPDNRGPRLFGMLTLCFERFL